MSPPSTDTPAAPDLGAQLQRLLNTVVRVSEDARRPDLAGAVHRELQRGPRRIPVVVVAGETKRGKSSLVNALLDRPGLSPTGPGTVTNTFVAFSYSETPSMLVGLEAQSDDTDGGTEELEVDITELDEWATVAGNPANFKRVGSVQVRVPSTLLQSMVLVDTPGVGTRWRAR